jgi:hypothetical protein
MRWIVHILGFFLLYQSFVFADYQEDMNKLDNLNLSYEYIHSDNGTKLYYVKQLLNKTNHDASGVTAKVDIKSKSIRKKFYKQIVYKLIENSSVKENYNSSLEIFNKIEEIGDSTFNNGDMIRGTFDTTLDFIEESNNNNLYSAIRKHYLGWEKHATFKNVKNRLNTLSTGLKTLEKDIKIAQVTLSINHDIMQFFISNSLEAGILLDKIELLQEMNSKEDSALTEVLSEISNEIISRNNGMINRGISIIKAMHNQGEVKIVDLGADFILDYGVGKLTSLLFNSTGIGVIAAFGIDELKHEFYDAPKLLKEHILLTTLLWSSFETSPLSKKALNEAFTRTYQYESQDSYKQYQQDKITIFLFSMFFKNMNNIASDRGWVEALNGGIFFMFFEKYLDRDEVKKVSQSLDENLQKRFTNVVLESKYDIDITTNFINSKCYLPKAPLSISLSAKVKENDVSTNDFKVLWLVRNSKDYIPTFHINSSFDVSKGGTYHITPIITIKGKNSIIVDTKIVVVKDSDVTIKNIEIRNKKKFNYTLNDDFTSQLVSRWTPVFANYSDNTSGMINSCTELSLLVQDTNIATLNWKLYLNPKKEGSTELVAKLLDYEDRATVSIFNIFRDVPSDKWYSPYVKELKDKKIVTGYDDKTFKPAKLVNVVEALTMVYRTVMKKTNDGDEIKVLDVYTIPYNDYSVKNSSNGWFFHALYFSSAIPLLNNLNVKNPKDRENSISFWKIGEFNPSGNLSRGEMAHMIVNALHLEVKAVADYKNNPFSDLSSTHQHYRWIMACYENGIIGGYDDGSFKPDKQVNRAEMSKFVYYLYEKLDKDMFRSGG